MLCKVWWSWVGWLKRNKLVLESMKKKVSVKFFLKTIMLVSSKSYRHPCLLSKLSGHFSLLTFRGCDPHFYVVTWGVFCENVLGLQLKLFQNIIFCETFKWNYPTWDWLFPEFPFPHTYVDRYRRRKFNLPTSYFYDKKKIFGKESK